MDIQILFIMEDVSLQQLNWYILLEYGTNLS